MEATINQIQEIVSVLTSDEQQLLKDTINYGQWGDTDWNFWTEMETRKRFAVLAIAQMTQKRRATSKGVSFPRCSNQFIKRCVQNTTTR